jgi:hypothetical protein
MTTTGKRPSHAVFLEKSSFSAPSMSILQRKGLQSLCLSRMSATVMASMAPSSAGAVR